MCDKRLRKLENQYDKNDTSGLGITPQDHTRYSYVSHKWSRYLPTVVPRSVIYILKRIYKCYWEIDSTRWKISNTFRTVWSTFSSVYIYYLHWTYCEDWQHKCKISWSKWSKTNLDKWYKWVRHHATGSHVVHLRLTQVEYLPTVVPRSVISTEMNM